MGIMDEKIKKLREQAKEHADNSAVIEEIIDIPEEIDESRLAGIAKDLDFKEEVTANKSDAPPPTGSIKVLVLSVTDLPFAPAKQMRGEQPPQPIKEYEILIKTTQPLQLGKEYTIKL